jgi:four helix bundle protein
MGIAQKEINEAIYWLELLKATDYLSSEQFDSMSTDAIEIIKLVTSILKSTKANINN